MTRATSIVLAVLGFFEIATLAVLLTNLATVHERALTRVVGPVHGAIYLVVVLMVLLIPKLGWRTRVLGVVPVIGAALAVWRGTTSKSPPAT